MKLFLLRYGELGTKSISIRRNFEFILIDNIERMFLKEGEEIVLERTRGRIFAHADATAGHIFTRIFGLVSFSPVRETSSEINSILKEGAKIWTEKEGSFAVRARRTGTHPYTSQELAAAVGGAVLEVNPQLTVDLSSPDHELHVEVRDSKAYLFIEIYNAPGGLPLGSQGKVAAYVENKNDFLAAWLMMKRGARTYIIHPPDNKWADALDGWDPNLKRMEVDRMDDILSLKLPTEVQGLVTGDTLKSLRCIEHGLPVFRPLVGFTEERIKGYVKDISKLIDIETQH